MPYVVLCCSRNLLQTAAWTRICIRNRNCVWCFCGASAYISTKNSTSSQTTAKPKVTSTVKNDIVDLPRTGSALKTDPYHAFPNIIDNYAGYATKSPISNGTLYQLSGSLNGTAGRFEWIVQNQQVTHRMFVKGGTINGIQILP